MIFVREAKYLEAYRISVTFNDGITKVVDLSGILSGPMFEALKDPNVFSQFQVDPESDTLVWPNGADIAPEFLYEKGVIP